jgi:cytochrome c oxidase cbb3-type subunit IV
MSQGTYAALVTVVLFVCFVGGLIWLFGKRRRADFEAAARLPLEDEHEAPKAPRNSSENTP